MLRHARFPLLILALVVIPYLLFGDRIEAFAAARLGEELKPVAYGAIAVALLASDIFLPIPSSIVGLGAGAALGVAGGTLANFVGLSMGCLIGYAVGAHWGGPASVWMTGLAGHARLVSFVQKWGVAALVVLRAVPVLAEASVLVAGSAGLRFKSVVAATTLSNLGVGFAYALAGAWLKDQVSLVALTVAVIGLPLASWLISRTWMQLRRR